jgi:hypothetical protein
VIKLVFFLHRPRFRQSAFVHNGDSQSIRQISLCQTLTAGNKTLHPQQFGLVNRSSSGLPRSSNWSSDVIPPPTAGKEIFGAYAPTGKPSSAPPLTAHDRSFIAKVLQSLTRFNYLIWSENASLLRQHRR